MLKITNVSHLDHGISTAILSWLLTMFADKNEFFIATVKLPVELGNGGTVPCDLRGPMVGDDPVPDSLCSYGRRGEQRKWDTRFTTMHPTVSTDVTIIAGPHGDDACVLYTVYGGPCAPREPGDPSLAATPEQHAESVAFWKEHAISFYAKR